MTVETVAQILDHALADPFKEIGIEKIKDTLEQKKPQQGHRKDNQPLFMLFVENLIQQRFDHIGLGGIEDGNNNHCQHGDEHFPSVRLQHLIETREYDFICHGITACFSRGDLPILECIPCLSLYCGRTEMKRFFRIFLPRWPKNR